MRNIEYEKLELNWWDCVCVFKTSVDLPQYCLMFSI